MTAAPPPEGAPAATVDATEAPAIPTLPDLPAQWDDGNEAPATPRGDAPPPDPWTTLRRLTPARIALGRAGTSLPTGEVLRFAAAHAQARDAVHAALDVQALARELRDLGVEPRFACSQAPTRTSYLARPDLGRRLDEPSRDALEAAQAPRADGTPPGPATVCIVVADGLSAVAAQSHAASVIAALSAALQAASAAAPARGADLVLGPVVIATQARVALGDEIGALCGASAVLVLIGERPGLSSPDSLGAYLTWAPAPGRADSERNCVSNIRPAGLPPAAASRRIAWLLREAVRRRTSGIALKDDSDIEQLGPA